MTVLDEYWQALVASAALGTDRREPPSPPAGMFADLAADDRRDDAAGRLLQQAAAVTVARRTGLLPVPPEQTTPLAPPPPDARPVTSPRAGRHWRDVVSAWPVLEDEWLVAVQSSGRRLSPDLVVPALVRHRGDALRHARVRAAAGPLGDWLIDWNPRLGATSRRRIDPAQLGVLPELAVTAGYATLLASDPRRDRPADVDAVVAAAITSDLHDRGVAEAQRPVLVNAMARVHPLLLRALHRALCEVHASATSHPSAQWAVPPLVDLVAVRHDMLVELGALPGPPLLDTPRPDTDTPEDR